MRCFGSVRWGLVRDELGGLWFYNYGFGCEVRLLYSWVLERALGAEKFRADWIVLGGNL